MELAENFDGFNVDRVLLVKFVLLVAGNESEVVNVPVEIGERKFNRGNAATFEQRQVDVFFRFQIVQRDAREIGNDDVARNSFTRPSRAKS